MRVNLLIIAMRIVDTWRLWLKQFYGNLFAELIDNTYNQVAGVAQAKTNNAQDDNNFNPEYLDPITDHARSGDGVHLRRCTMKRSNSNHVFQG